MKQILIIFSIIFPFLAYSLTIESDQLDVNLKEKNATFRGNVKVKNDKIDFSADLVEVEIDDKSNDLSKIKAVKAYMNKGQLHGTIKSGSTTYNLLSSLIILDLVNNKIVIEDANLSDKTSNITGDKIIYDMKTDLVSASSKNGKKVKISISNGQKIE